MVGIGRLELVDGRLVAFRHFNATNSSLIEIYTVAEKFVYDNCY